MRKYLQLVLLVTVACSCSYICAQEPEWGPFDRALVTERFLDAIYPEIKHYAGVLIFRAVEFHTFTGQKNAIDFVLCHPGSGIVTYGDPQTAKNPPPSCGDGRYFSGQSAFLTMDVAFGMKYPISSFGAGGSFVHAKSDAVDKEIAVHPEWDDHQRINAVRNANPKYGPDNKDAFLSSLPLEVIAKFTRCYLQPETTEFIAYRDEDGVHNARGHVEWRMGGHRKLESTGEDANCVARFEPFEGKLIYIGSF